MSREEILAWLSGPSKLSREDRLIEALVLVSEERDRLRAVAAGALCDRAVSIGSEGGEDD